MYKFMYTRSEILLESAFYGDLVKIDVATDMMYETYIDEMLYADTEEEFNEAGKGIVGTLIQMIGSAIGKIIKFFKDRIANVKKSAGMKKILKTMDSETKDAVIRISSKEKVKLPDTQKAAKLLDQAERGMTAMVDKVSSQIASFEGMKPSKKTKEYDKLLKYVDSACEKIQGIYDEANKVLSTPVEVPVATAFKYMETGVELTERSEKLEKELTKYRDDLVASINKIDLTTESVMAFVDADDDETFEESVEDEYDSLYEEKQKDKVVETALAEADSATKTKGVVGRTLSGISTFVHNHAKVIAITIGSVATAAGTILVLHKTGVDEKIANKLKKAEKTGEVLKGDVVDADGKVVSGKALKNIGNALKNSRGSQKGVGDSRSGQRRLTSKDTVASYSDPLIRSLWLKDLKVRRA